MTAVDDTLPQRILTEPRPDGGSAGSHPDLELRKAENYRFRGWASNGAPVPETLARLGLAGARGGG